MSKLAELPGRYRLTEEEPWRSLGIRKMPVENFLVYFWIDEENCCVWITAVVYQRRDQLAALRKMPVDRL